MNEYRFGVLVLALVSVTAWAAVSAQPLAEVEPPDDFRLLVQKELDYLPAVERSITLRVDKAEPAAVLREIGKRSKLAIEVHGSLPKQPVLSAEYRDTKAKVVLEWFAQQVPVSFRAEPPNKLWVIVEERDEGAATP